MKNISQESYWKKLKTPKLNQQKVLVNRDWGVVVKNCVKNFFSQAKLLQVTENTLT